MRLSEYGASFLSFKLLHIKVHSCGIEPPDLHAASTLFKEGYSAGQVSPRIPLVAVLVVERKKPTFPNRES